MNKVETEYPLVSIIVITYNSAKFVVETLESCKEQTYQKIELIVSDDGSTDDTATTSKKWLEKNEVRFVNTKFITVSKNTGISGNCNRGLRLANGTYIKIIAGDDVLLPDCIKDNINYIGKNPEALVVHSKRLDYQDNFQEENFIEEYTLENHPFGSSYITPSEQFQVLLRQVYVSAPTAFINKALLEEMQGFDERIPMIEDWPLWLKVTSAGYKIHYLNKATIKYRLHPDSASAMNNKTRLFPKTEEMKEDVHKLYIYPFIPTLERFLYEYNFKRMKLINFLGINRGSKILRILNKLTAYPAIQFRYSKAERLSKKTLS